MWRDNFEEVKALMSLELAVLGTFISKRGITQAQAYNLSKQDVIVMIMAEAMVARGFALNSVSPAAVSTGILKEFAAAFGDRMTRNVGCAGRAVNSHEIAGHDCFHGNAFRALIKGQDITIDGCMVAIAANDAMDLPRAITERT